MPTLSPRHVAAGESVTGFLSPTPCSAGTKPSLISAFGPLVRSPIRLAEYGDAEAPAPTGDMPNFSNS